MHTPEGEVWQERFYPHDDPDTLTRKWIKDLETELHLLPYVFRIPAGYRRETIRAQKAAVAGRHAIGACVGIPGFHWWSTDTLDGGLEALTYLELDRPDLVDELRARHYAMALRQVELILDSREFDYLFIGASGGITLSSPALFDKYALPFVQEATRLSKQAGVPTLLHSCGKEAHIVQRAAECTDLSCINPLEIPPMGDCDLAETKRRYGHKLALMGNLHTTEVMLRGTVDEVRAAACQAIDDAGAGGGFILSTGDQCGRDTPDENIRALVDVAQTYGRYA
jgi:uroporphyrinogen decarboxylase